MKRILLPALAVMVVSGFSVANAALIGTATAIVPPGNFVGPWAGLNGGDWSSYQLGLESTDGSLITAVDVTIGGTFHQSWSDPEFDDIINPSPTGPAGAATGDSYLTPVAGALVGSAPTEDNGGANGAGGSPLNDTFVPGTFTGGFDHGVGSLLDGAWGIPGAQQSTATNIAKVVIPTGSAIQTDIVVRVSTNNGTFALTNQDFVGTPFAVPEPTSVALAGLMTLVGLARRQR